MICITWWTKIIESLKQYKKNTKKSKKLIRSFFVARDCTLAAHGACSVSILHFSCFHDECNNWHIIAHSLITLGYTKYPTKSSPLTIFFPFQALSPTPKSLWGTFYPFFSNSSWPYINLSSFGSLVKYTFSFLVVCACIIAICFQYCNYHCSPRHWHIWRDDWGYSYIIKWLQLKMGMWGTDVQNFTLTVRLVDR